jgi:hypothetical protein
MCPSMSSTWNYIQDTMNNQRRVMTEKLYEILNNKLNNLRASIYKKTGYQQKHNEDNTNQAPHTSVIPESKI